MFGVSSGDHPPEGCNPWWPSLPKIQNRTSGSRIGHELVQHKWLWWLPGKEQIEEEFKYHTPCGVIDPSGSGWGCLYPLRLTRLENIRFLACHISHCSASSSSSPTPQKCKKWSLKSLQWKLPQIITSRILLIVTEPKILIWRLELLLKQTWPNLRSYY